MRHQAKIYGCISIRISPRIFYYHFLLRVHPTNVSSVNRPKLSSLVVAVNPQLRIDFDPSAGEHI